MEAWSSKRRVFGRLAVFALLVSLILSLVPVWAQPRSMAAAPPAFADSAFQKLWALTDAPVAAGQVQRSWYWGPQPGTTLSEQYAGSKTGKRLVQYFDKARMEINDPLGDRSSPWYVTTGLLVAEMVSGKQQVGDKQYVVKRAAEIAVGGDGLETDPDAPTYTSFRPVSSLRGPGDNKAPNRTGQQITATIDRAGHVGDNSALGLYPEAKVAAYSDVLGHNIPQAMWDFLNLKGVVNKNGTNVGGQTLANWIFVMGYPISEPYWARVKIGGIYQDALFQMYERRSLAYVPALPKGWQVQMGNVGEHYYRWIYGGSLPEPLLAQALPTAAVQPQVPPSVDADVSPEVAAVGTPLSVALSGMRPGEGIVSWFTAPDGKTTGQPFNLVAGPDGKVKNISISTIAMSPGQWAVTYHGKASGHESIAYFLLTPGKGGTPSPSRTRTSTPVPGTPQTTAVATSTRLPPTSTRPPAPRGSATPTPTFPTVPTEPPGGLVLMVDPGYGPPDAQFTLSARGLQPGETAQVKFTDPTGTVVYPNGSNGQYAVDPSGRLAFALQPDTAFPSAPLGTWLFEVDGLSSGLQGVVGFTLR